MPSASVGEPVARLEPQLGDDERNQIIDALDRHNLAVTKLPDWIPADVTMRETDGKIVAASLGYVWGGWLQVTYLWVEESYRGRGYGGRLLDMAESFARSCGAKAAALETHSFQARPFYERRGYVTVGEIEDYPLGHSKYFLKKSLL